MAAPRAQDAAVPAGPRKAEWRGARGSLALGGGGLGTSVPYGQPAHEADPPAKRPSWLLPTGASTFPRGPGEREGAGCGQGASGCGRHQGGGPGGGLRSQGEGVPEGDP